MTWENHGNSETFRALPRRVFVRVSETVNGFEWWGERGVPGICENMGEGQADSREAARRDALAWARKEVQTIADDANVALARIDAATVPSAVDLVTMPEPPK